MSPLRFQIRPIPESQLEQVRRTRLDALGSPVVAFDELPDEPLRCCLRNSRTGEPVLLFGYEPPVADVNPIGPYREVGGVLAHAHPCGAAPSWQSYPPEWIGRPQVLRAYDDRGWIHPATTTHDGSDPISAISQVLETPGVVEVHSRNVSYGCFMFSASAQE